MPLRNVRVSRDLFRIDRSAIQQLVEQRAAPRTWLAIHDSNPSACKIVDGLQPLRISCRNHQSCLPARESDHAEISIRKFAADERKIELARFRVLQMRSRNVD